LAATPEGSTRNVEAADILRMRLRADERAITAEQDRYAAFVGLARERS